VRSRVEKALLCSLCLIGLFVILNQKLIWAICLLNMLYIMRLPDLDHFSSFFTIITLTFHRRPSYSQRPFFIVHSLSQSIVHPRFDLNCFPFPSSDSYPPKPHPTPSPSLYAVRHTHHFHHVYPSRHRPLHS